MALRTRGVGNVKYVFACGDPKDDEPVDMVGIIFTGLGGRGYADVSYFFFRIRRPSEGSEYLKVDSRRKRLAILCARPA